MSTSVPTNNISNRLRDKALSPKIAAFTDVFKHTITEANLQSEDGMAWIKAKPEEALKALEHGKPALLCGETFYVDDQFAAGWRLERKRETEPIVVRCATRGKSVYTYGGLASSYDEATTIIAHRILGNEDFTPSRQGDLAHRIARAIRTHTYEGADALKTKSIADTLLGRDGLVQYIAQQWTAIASPGETMATPSGLSIHRLAHDLLIVCGQYVTLVALRDAGDADPNELANAICNIASRATAPKTVRIEIYVV